MLSLFIAKAYSDAFAMIKPTDKDAAFDLKFLNASSGFVPITYKNRGFFVKISVTDEEGNVKTSLLRYDNRKETKINELKISWSENFDTKTNLYTVTFNIYNSGFFPKKVDLGIFADCGFDDNDNAPITQLADGRGFFVTSAKYSYTTFIRDFGSFPNVDTVFIGDLAETTMYDPSYYPYFKNEQVAKTSSDSVFAFSWKDKEIMGETTLKLGFTLGAGVNFDTPPRVFDVSNIKGTYSPDDQVEIKCKVVDYDTSDTVTMFISIFDGEPETKVFHPTADNKIGYISKTISPEEPATPYKCWAKDSRDYISNEVTGVIFSNDAPTIEIKAPEKTEYYPHEQIAVKCTLTDDESLYLKYQFDNGLIFQVGDLLRINGEVMDVLLHAAIPQQLKPGKEHTLYIWVQDGDGAVSEKKSFKFMLKPPNAPELLSVYASDPAYIKGRTNLIVFGEVTDKDVGQVMTIYGKPGPEYPPTELGKHLIEKINPPFAFLYDIPKEVPVGIRDLLFDVVDDTNTTGKGNSVRVRVCEPGTECADPPTPEPSESPVTFNPTTKPTTSSTSNRADQATPNQYRDYKSKKSVIWTLTVLNIIAVIVLLVIGVFWIRKRMISYDAFNDDTTTEGDEELSESAITPTPGSVSATADNPLFTSGIPQSDDVFTTDFHEETTVDVFRFNNDEENPDLGI